MRRQGNRLIFLKGFRVTDFTLATYQLPPSDNRANEPRLAGDDDSFEDPKTIHLTFRNLIENRNSPRIE